MSPLPPPIMGCIALASCSTIPSLFLSQLWFVAGAGEQVEFSKLKQATDDKFEQLREFSQSDFDEYDLTEKSKRDSG